MQSLYDFAATDSSAWASGRALIEDTMTPVSAMACPCDTCPRANKCAIAATACAAFESWSSSGRFVKSDLARRIRAA